MKCNRVYSVFVRYKLNLSYSDAKAIVKSEILTSEVFSGEIGSSN